MHQPIKVNYIRSLLPLLITTVLPFTFSSITFFFISTYEETFNSFTLLHWILFYSLTIFTMAFALTPTTYISLFTGYFIGWYGLLGLIPSYIIASLLGFTISRKIDNGQFVSGQMASKKIQKLIQGFKENEFKTIFYARLNPTLPFAMMNILLGYLNVSLKNFIVAGTLGMLPRTMLSIFMGSQAQSIINAIFKNNQSIDYTHILLVVLFFISTLSLLRIIQQSLKTN